MAKKKIETPRELVNYIKSVLSDKWWIEVGETTRCEWSPILGPANVHYWYVTVTILEPLKVGAFIQDTSFPGLVKSVDSRLWDKLKEDFLKHQTVWSPNPQAIEAAQPKIAGRQLALTHQPGV